MNEVEHGTRVRRVCKRKTRSSRQLRLVLMSIGYAGLALGAVLFVLSLVRHNRRLALMGAVYVLCAAAVLAVRGALQEWDRIRKARSSRNHSRAGAMQALSAADGPGAVSGTGEPA